MRITGQTGDYNVDDFPVSYDTWERFAVEYDRTAWRADVVRVFRDGVVIGENTIMEGFAPDSFANAVFFVGARGGPVRPAHYLTGQIDNLKIEGARAGRRPTTLGRGIRD